MKLTQSAAKILSTLVVQIRTGRFNPDKPETFLGYGEALQLIRLPETAPRGPTDGVTLQVNGMEELAIWLQGHSPPLPAITGLLVSKSDTDINGLRRTPGIPGRRFFTICKRKDEDYGWWLDQARAAIEFDWSPFLPPTVPPSALIALSSLERALIEKAGYSHGWENTRESSSTCVVMYSARHNAEVFVSPTSVAAVWQATFPKGPATGELAHSLPSQHLGGDIFEATNEASLGRLLRRAAELAMALPNQAAEQYAIEVAKIEANPPSTTEAFAFVKQRRGQDLFRAALMDYWGGACAVSGIAIPQLLRASHTKPWAACDTDEERLNVYNGFLLCSHFDALFDSGLVTFSEGGTVLFSSTLDETSKATLGLHSNLKLRWKTSHHEEFLKWHRDRYHANFLS